MKHKEQEKWLVKNLLHVLNLPTVDFFLVETQENRRLFDQLGFLNELQLRAQSIEEYYAYMNWLSRAWTSRIYYYFDPQGSLVMRSKTRVNNEKPRLCGFVSQTKELHLSDEVYF